eukprot:5452387-Prymnesium_polylepis.1
MRTVNSSTSWPISQFAPVSERTNNNVPLWAVLMPRSNPPPAPFQPAATLVLLHRRPPQTPPQTPPPILLRSHRQRVGLLTGRRQLLTGQAVDGRLLASGRLLLALEAGDVGGHVEAGDVGQVGQ